MIKQFEDKISVIIPFYRNVGWLEDAVNSVFAQTYKNIEIIVVDDGSFEDVSGFLSKHGAKLVYIKTRNRGPGSARNLGIKMATGTYIAFLDSDDVWLPTKVEKQLNFMKQKDLIWSHSNYYQFYNDKKTESESLVNVSYFQGNIYPKCLIRNPIATPCVMIKAEFLDENPQIRFSECVRYGEDSFFWLNIGKSCSLGALDEALTRVRIRGSNAAFSARVKLISKSHLYRHLLRNYNEYRDVGALIRILYKYCDIANRLINLFGKMIKRDSVMEIISKGLYLPAYLCFKTARVLQKDF